MNDSDHSIWQEGAEGKKTEEIRGKTTKNETEKENLFAKRKRNG